MEKYLPIIVIIFTSFCIGQNKYLVSSSGDYIKIPHGQSATELLAKINTESVLNNNPARSPSAWLIRGFPTWDFPPDTMIRVYQKDVIGSWFVVPSRGTIDTVYWCAGNANSAKDSMIFLRIHESKIGPDWGPGIPPYPSPPVSWGYWKNSLDLERGIAAFPDDATDTTWYSTIDEMGGTVPKTRPSWGYSKWGALGFGKVSRPGICSIGMLEAGEPCSVQVGEKFFISFRINSGVFTEGYGNPNYCTELSASRYGVPTPPQAWAFYEHDSVPSPTAKRGWHVLDGVNINIWYLINTPQPYPGSVITGHKFHDLNNNGSWEEGEPGVSGWSISLSGRYSTSTQTDINGFYQFTGLDSGTYVVSEGQRTGWIPTYPPNGEYEMHLTLNDTIRNIDFGNFKISSFLIRKFQDLDGDIATTNDRVSQPWNLNLYRDSISTETLVAAVSSGTYLSVPELMPGTYIATEADSIGWHPIGKITNGSVKVGQETKDTLILTSGQSGDISFINCRPRIVVKKYADTDGIFTTSNDRIKKTWPLFLYRDSIYETCLYASSYDSSSLEVYNPPPGIYFVVESDSLTWTNIGKVINNIATSGNYRVDSFQYFTNMIRAIDFINHRQVGTISGCIFKDANRNGDRDIGEYGLKNWWVRYNGRISDSVLTDNDGNYYISELPMGTYTLNQNLKIGWEQIYPSNPYSHIITLVSNGQQFTGIDFGNAITIPKLKLPLSFYNSDKTATRDVYWGLRSGAANGIWGIDPSATSADSTEGEKDLPPPMAGAFDVRLINPDHQPNLFGNGSWTDIRNFVSSSQCDTYKLSFQPGPKDYPVIFKWSKDLVSQSFYGDIRIGVNKGNSVDMKIVDSLVITNVNTSMLYIYTEDPAIPIRYEKGWNIVSLPSLVEDPRRLILFPTSISDTYIYDPAMGYEIKDTLEVGIGYWIKFNGVIPPIALDGIDVNSTTISVFTGWNLVGAITNPISVDGVTSNPPGIVASDFFGYNGSYFASDTLKPFMGYWVKVNQDGQLMLSAPIK